MSPASRPSQLQFLVLGTLLRGERLGREIREDLQRFDIKRSGPSFYQLMSRLEEAKLVAGRYEQCIVNGQIIRQRSYRLTAIGRRTWNDSRGFYETIIAEFAPSNA